MTNVARTIRLLVLTTVVMCLGSGAAAQEAAQTGPFGIDSYNLVDTTIAYEWAVNEYDLRVAVVGKNLGDTEYIEQALPSVGFQTWGPPRYIGVELGLNY